LRLECEALTGRPMPGSTLGWELDRRPAACCCWSLPAAAAAAAEPMTARGPAACWPEGAPAAEDAQSKVGDTGNG
jgi:hypothetical protein